MQKCFRPSDVRLLSRAPGPSLAWHRQVDALLIEKCEAWYERRGLPVRKLGSVKAAMKVAEKWEQLLGLTRGDMDRLTHGDMTHDSTEKESTLSFFLFFHKLHFLHVRRIQTGIGRLYAVCV